MSSLQVRYGQQKRSIQVICKQHAGSIQGVPKYFVDSIWLSQVLQIWFKWKVVGAAIACNWEAVTLKWSKLGGLNFFFFFLLNFPKIHSFCHMFAKTKSQTTHLFQVCFVRFFLRTHCFFVQLFFAIFVFCVIYVFKLDALAVDAPHCHCTGLPGNAELPPMPICFVSQLH